MTCLTITLAGSPIEPAVIVTPSRETVERVAAPLAGMAALLGLWWLGGWLIAGNPRLTAFQGFAPAPALQAFGGLLTSGDARRAAVPSLSRVLQGLAFAFLIGVPVGFGAWRAAPAGTRIAIAVSDPAHDQPAIVDADRDPGVSDVGRRHRLPDRGGRDLADRVCDGGRREAHRSRLAVGRAARSADGAPAFCSASSCRRSRPTS